MRRSVLALAVLLAGCGRRGFEERHGADAAIDAVVDATIDVPGDSIDAPVTRTPPLFVQTRSADGNGTTTCTLAYSNAVAAGDLLVATIDITPSSSAVLVGVTDNRGDTFTALGPFDGNGVRHYITHAYAAGGPTTVTAEISSATNMYFDLRLHEYANTALVSPIEMAASKTGTSTGTDAATVTLTTTEPNEMIFALATFVGTGNEGSGFSVRSTYDGDVTEDRIVALPGAHDATATTGAASWVISAAAIRGR